MEEEPADVTGEQEGEPEESAPEAEEKDTPSAVGLAQIQVEKILEDARQQVEDYLVRRQMEAEQGAEQVRQQTQSEGYRQSYVEGLRQAGVEGQVELQKQREQQVEKLRASLREATAAREELLWETQGKLCELSLAIMGKVIHISLNSSNEVVARVTQVATEKPKRRGQVHIYVDGCAAKEVSAITSELMTALVSLSDHIKITPLSDDEADTYVIEMPGEIIDANASTQLKNIRDLICKIQGGGSAGKGPKATFQEMVRQIQRAEAISYMGKIEDIVGISIKTSDERAAVGDICQIYNGDVGDQIVAEMVGFKNNHILLIPYSGISDISTGNSIRNTGRRFSLRMGPFLKGWVINTLEQPVDGKDSFRGGTLFRVENNHYISPMTCPPTQERMEFNAKTIDSMLAVGEGQYIGIFAGSDVGKSALMGMIAKNVEADINVITLVGEYGREVLEFMGEDLGPEGIWWFVLAIAASDQSAMLRRQCPSAATKVTEFFRDQGYDVLLMMDSPARLAIAQREIGLVVNEPPVSRGYTPSTYVELPKLPERSGNFQRGSITGIYTILVKGDDTNEPIADMVYGILDGHIALSRRLANSNHSPATDTEASISRLMANIVSDEYRWLAARMRGVTGIYERNVDLVSVGAYEASTNPRLGYALGEMDEINQFLTQGVDEAFPYEEDLEAIWRPL